MKKRVDLGCVPRSSATVPVGDYRPDLKYKLLLNDREAVLLADLIDDHILDLVQFCKDSGTTDGDFSLWFEIANRLHKSAFPDC